MFDRILNDAQKRDVVPSHYLFRNMIAMFERLLSLGIFWIGVGIFCDVPTLGSDNAAPVEKTGVSPTESFFSLSDDFEAVRLSSLIGSNDREDYADSVAPIMLVGGVTTGKRYSYTSRSYSWYDASRRRTIPARIYCPASRSERYPIIVFSHGLGGSPDCCSYLGAAWASRGFVVVLLQHPGSDENVWKGKLRILNELRESYKYNWSGRTRAQDIRYGIDRLEILAQTDPMFAAILNLDRIGVGGYDLGSLAALLVAGQIPPDNGPSLADPRVKAILAMSPPVNTNRGCYIDTYGAINVPAFFITGTEDDGIVGSTKAQQRRIPYDSISGCSRFLVVFDGADHMIYGGHFLALRARKDQRFQDAICRITTVFWRAYLRGDEQALHYVTGYRLRSMLGVSATIERQIIPNDFVEYRTDNHVENVDSTSPAMPGPNSGGDENEPQPDSNMEPLQPPTKKQELPETNDSLNTPILTDTFPVTRLYREFVSTVDATP